MKNLSKKISRIIDYIDNVMFNNIVLFVIVVSSVTFIIFGTLVFLLSLALSLADEATKDTPDEIKDKCTHYAVLLELSNATVSSKIKDLPGLECMTVIGGKEYYWSYASDENLQLAQILLKK